MSEPFALHPQLAAGTIRVADWALSQVLLMDDARFPWIILVPRRLRLSELHDLDEIARLGLMDEIARAGAGMKRLFAARKINTGALGNIVPQLHVHVVARQADDVAWPGPVWGHGQREPYLSAAREAMVERLVTGL